jgi:hypothetical protein
MLLIWDLVICYVCCIHLLAHTPLALSSNDETNDRLLHIDLPPLWFHSVLSVDQCISISVWSVSHEQDIFDQ